MLEDLFHGPQTPEEKPYNISLLSAFFDAANKAVSQPCMKMVDDMFCRRQNGTRDNVKLEKKIKETNPAKLDRVLQWGKATTGVKVLAWALLGTARRMVTDGKFAKWGELLQTGEEKLVEELATETARELGIRINDLVGLARETVDIRIQSCWTTELSKLKGAAARIKYAAENLCAENLFHEGGPATVSAAAPNQAAALARATTPGRRPLLAAPARKRARHQEDVTDNWGIGPWKKVRMSGEVAKEYTTTDKCPPVTVEDLREKTQERALWKVPSHQIFLGPTLTEGGGHILRRADKTAPVYIFGKARPRSPPHGKGLILARQRITNRTLREVAQEDYGLPLSSAAFTPRKVKLQWGQMKPAAKTKLKFFIVARAIPAEVLRTVAPADMTLCSVQVTIDKVSVRDYEDPRIQYEVAFSSPSSDVRENEVEMGPAIGVGVLERLYDHWEHTTGRVFLDQGRIISTTVDKVLPGNSLLNELTNFQEVGKVLSPMPFDPLCFKVPVELVVSTFYEPGLWSHTAFQVDSDGSISESDVSSDDESESDNESENESEILGAYVTEDSMLRDAARAPVPRVIYDVSRRPQDSFRS